MQYSDCMLLVFWLVLTNQSASFQSSIFVYDKGSMDFARNFMLSCSGLLWLAVRTFPTNQNAKNELPTLQDRLQVKRAPTT